MESHELENTQDQDKNPNGFLLDILREMCDKNPNDQSLGYVVRHFMYSIDKGESGFFIPEIPTYHKRRR